MDELVLPVDRSHWTFQIVVAVLAAALGVFVVVYGLAVASTYNVVVGVICLVMFGSLLVGSLRGILSAGLVLSSRGLTYSSHSFDWSTVAGFHSVGLFGKTHVRIRFQPGADLPRNVRWAITASKFGLYYHPFTHIPMKGFVTDGQSLDAILATWLKKARATYN